jgi:malate/lactate dehydrogenase
VSNLAVWGNHSPTMFPDFYNTKVGGKPANEVIGDETWLKETFVPKVGKRGAAIIEARGGLFRRFPLPMPPLIPSFPSPPPPRKANGTASV